MEDLKKVAAYENETDYIEAYKKIITTKVLSVLLIFFLFSCNNKNTKVNDSLSKQDTINLIIDSTHISDSCKIALKRIKKFDNGIGNNSEVMKNYEKERDSYLKEIDFIYSKLLQNIKKNQSDESSKNLVAYHEQWKKYLDSKRNFESKYIMDHINSGEYIFYLKPFFEKEYENKLLEYYELYEFDQE